MHKTNVKENDAKITVDINGLQNMLSVGKNTAYKIGEEAGAVVRLGKRKLYIVSKVESYISRKNEVSQ